MKVISSVRVASLKSIFKKPKYKVAVVIPVYKAVLNDHEKSSLNRCFEVLHAHPIIFITPKSFNIQEIDLPTDKPIVKYFSDKFFADINSYNQLMLSTDFYNSFLDYKYILIYQLDSFVFSDQLLYWCGLSYDYIGAPWRKNMLPFLYQVPFWARHDKLRRLFGMSRFVGNGGFSLRKVKSFLLALHLMERKALEFRSNEDIFWSLLVPSYIPFFLIPQVDTALKFSFEMNPREYFKKNGDELPFGCHAWARYDIEFWRPIFENYGYTI